MFCSYKEYGVLKFALFTYLDTKVRFRTVLLNFDDYAIVINSHRLVFGVRF
jgi:hypothetical protein